MIEKKRGARGFWGGMLGIASVAFVTTAVAACSSTPTGVLADAATDTSKPTADAGHDVAHSCSVGKAACGGACVDTATDVDNCGASATRAPPATCAQPATAAPTVGAERASAAAAAPTCRLTRQTAESAGTCARQACPSAPSAAARSHVPVARRRAARPASMSSLIRRTAVPAPRYARRASSARTGCAG